MSPIIITGPTACGKSAAAIALAKKLDGEIICADSCQIYRGMQIGTSGPTATQCAQIPHHGYGEIDPTKTFDAGQFVALANKIVKEVLSRKKRPILVGGTGLYLRSFRYGIDEMPKKDDEIRKKIGNEISDSIR